MSKKLSKTSDNRILDLRYWILIFYFLFFPSFSLADSYLEKRVFFVDPNYELLSRERISAINLHISNKAYFYVDDEYFERLNSYEKQELYENLRELATEFDNKIYPELTSILGKEPQRGVTGDERVTILFHRMKEAIGGYWREADNFEKKLAPLSNERKMIYLNIFLVGKAIIKSNLAHEFSHLIQFEQKTKKIEEERWILEMISEVSPTLLGYFENLKNRIEIFKKYPKDPILEWKDDLKDYGILSIFAHYLLDQFGKEFFVELLKTRETGILAIEKLTKRDFSKIFENFLIASHLNDCTFGREYCFGIKELKDLRILPEFHFLPTTGESILTLFRQIKDFSGDWQKIYGGRGNLILEFEGKDGDFSISYLLCDKNQVCTLNFLKPNENQRATLSIPNFDKNYSSLTLITFSKKEKKFVGKEAKSYNFSFKFSFKQTEQISLPPPLLIPIPTPPLSCPKFQRNLRYGMRGEDVKCLQEILKREGPEIYPEGLVTGYFGPLTLSAVKRFQQRYWQEILRPWGLNQFQPTGFVGRATRAKLNQLLSR